MPWVSRSNKLSGIQRDLADVQIPNLLLNMHILFLQFDLQFPNALSLKDKRRVLKPILNAIRRDYNVSATEADYHDQWQRSVIAIVAVSTMKNALEKIERELMELLDTQEEALMLGHQSEWL